MMIVTETTIVIVDAVAGVENELSLSLSLSMVVLFSTRTLRCCYGCFVEPAAASPLAYARTVAQPATAWLGHSKDRLLQHHYHRPAAGCSSRGHCGCHGPMRLSTTRGCSRSPAMTHREHSSLHKARPASVLVGRGPSPSTFRETPGTTARHV